MEKDYIYFKVIFTVILGDFPTRKIKVWLMDYFRKRCYISAASVEKCLKYFKAANQMKVLVIDDDQAICDMVRAVLHVEGYEVSCAENVEDAARLIRGEFFDVVLLDYKVGDKNGESFLGAAAFPRGTKVILITGFLESEMVKRMFKMGICGYISKPFDATDLIRNIDYHLKKNQAEYTA